MALRERVRAFRERLLRRFFPMTVTRTVTVEVSGTLSVSVTAIPEKGYVGDTFRFDVDWSPISGAECMIDIDYGDGTGESTSVYSPPATFTHAYSSPGTYTVKVTAYDTAYMAEGSDQTSVVVRAKLIVSLDASPKSGNVPLDVTFTCEARGGYLPYSWTLDFGDGSTPTSGTRTSEGSWTVTHTYGKSGSFTAKLTVSDALGETSAAALGIGVEVPACPLWMRRLYEAAKKRNLKTLKEILLRMASRRGCSLE